MTTIEVSIAEAAGTPALGDLFEAAKPRLGVLAHRAITQGHAPASFFVLAIEVDSVWRPAVDQLLPGYDWQAIRDRGEVPFAHVVVPRDAVITFVGAALPDLLPALRVRPTPGLVHAVVLAGKAGGGGIGAVFALAPIAEAS